MKKILEALGIDENPSAVYADGWIETPGGAEVASISPITGNVIARVRTGNKADYARVMDVAAATFLKWRQLPAPKRGDIMREIGNAFREKKEALGALVTLEMGKIASEGLGEVQEMIDMADLAVGMSRQMCGQTMHSERDQHRMYEQWHPLGTVGIISAFNFPVAVWSWNAFIAAICGNAMVWKPSLKTPLCAIACQNIVAPILKKHDMVGLMTLITGTDAEVGETMISDRRLPLISATGSCRMGKRVGEVVGGRLGRSLLELGGNNAIILTPEANLDLALTGVVFGAVGTAGQRCTTTRRLIIHESLVASFVPRLVAAYKSVRIGDPLESETLMGPLIDRDAVAAMRSAVASAEGQGGKILCGGSVLSNESGCYVEPCVIEAHADMAIVAQETFAPILYILPYNDLNEAIEIQNSVDQGLSSAIFTTNLLDAETFLSHCGSDCGIANVNIGTSGAEIGGAFGGEKETGGGREAGSDAWKVYMRRQTNTINYSTTLPLAQGVQFDLES